MVGSEFLKDLFLKKKERKKEYSQTIEVRPLRDSSVLSD